MPKESFFLWFWRFVQWVAGEIIVDDAINDSFTRYREFKCMFFGIGGGRELIIVLAERQVFDADLATIIRGTFDNEVSVCIVNM